MLQKLVPIPRAPISHLSRAPSYLQCLEEANLLAQLLKLGFVLNLKKSELLPTQEKVFLGVNINSKE